MAGVKGHSHHDGGAARRAVEAGGRAGGDTRTTGDGRARTGEAAQQGGEVRQGENAQQTEGPGRGRGRKLGHKKRKRRGGGAGQGAQGAEQLARGGGGKAGKADKADKADKAEKTAGAKGAEQVAGQAGTAGGGGSTTDVAGMAGCDMAMHGAAELGAAPTTAGAMAEPATAAQLAALAPTAPATNPLIATALQQVGSSPMARQVLETIAANNAKIEVMSDAAMASTYGARTKGAFDPASNTIVLPESIAKNPTQLRLVLFHEGVHWLQDNVPGGAEALGGPIGDALRSAGAVRQTTTQTDDMQHDEAQAYLLEAKLAADLGIRDGGLGTDASGRPLDYTAVLQRVKSTAEYA